MNVNYFRGVLSYTKPSRVVLIEYTVQETFQTEAALLAWSTQYVQNELPGHLRGVLHYVRNPPGRGLLRPLWGPRAGAMLYRRVQRGKKDSLVESISTRREDESSHQGRSAIQEDQLTSDHSEQLLTSQSVSEGSPEERRSFGQLSNSVRSDRDTSVDKVGSKRLQRSSCSSNACYHTAPPLAFDKLFGPGSDQSLIGIGDLGKQFKKPSIISRAPKKQKTEERVSSIDRVNELLPRVREFVSNNCISCQREFVGPSNFKYCPSCFSNRRSLL